MHVICFAVQMEDDVGGLVGICADHHHETEMRLHAPRARRASRNGPSLSPPPLPHPSRSRCIHVPVHMYLLRYLYSPVVDSSIARLSVPECLLGP